MTYLLDSNTLIAALNPRLRSTVVPRITAQAPTAVVTSSIVAHELFFGAWRSQRQADNLDRLALLFRDITPLELTAEDAAAAGRLRAQLATAGTPIGPYDVLIAGQALARGCVLVTSNTRAFARVDELTVVDWLA